MTSKQFLAITEDLTIYQALEQKQLLLDALANSDELALNLAHVAEMDTAGLQLLLLLKKEAQQAGKQVFIESASQAVSELLDFCKLTAEFGTPVITPSQQAA